MIKQFYLTTLILCLGLASIQAQDRSFYLETQFRFYKNDGLVPVVNSWAQSDYDNGFGLWNYNLAQADGYGESLIGLKYTKPINETGSIIEFGLGGGIETFEPAYRTAAFVYFETGDAKFTSVLYGEYGGSGDWYLGTFEYNHKNMSYGLHLQKFSLHGPRIGYTFSPIKIWMGVGYDFQSKQTTGILALQYDI